MASRKNIICHEDLEEYLPIEIYQLRVQKILQYELGNQTYVDEFGRCENCQVLLWIGRCGIIKNSYDYHYFDDYHKVKNRNNIYWPVCYACRDICICTHQNCKTERAYCQMCENNMSTT